MSFLKRQNAPIKRGPGGIGVPDGVLRLMADGLDTAEIAVKLSYSERTVKNVIYGLKNRLGLRNRTHAVACAIRTGWI